MREDLGIIKSTVRNLDVRINGSMDAISSHITAGHRWRTGIIAIGVTLICNLVGFAYGYGILRSTVEANAESIQEVKANTKAVDQILTLLQKKLN